MLKGFIEYFKETVSTAMTVVQTTPNNWSKKYCTGLIEQYKRQGYTIGAKAVTKYVESEVEIIGYVEAPETGYSFFNSEPCLIKALTKYNSIVMYHPKELRLINKETGEIYDHQTH